MWVAELFADKKSDRPITSRTFVTFDELELWLVLRIARRPREDFRVEFRVPFYATNKQIEELSILGSVTAGVR